MIVDSSVKWIERHVCKIEVYISLCIIQMHGHNSIPNWEEVRLKKHFL